MGLRDGATPLNSFGANTMTLIVSDTSAFHFRGTAKSTKHLRTFSMLNTMQCEATPSLCAPQTDICKDYLPRRSPLFCLVHPTKCSSAGGQLLGRIEPPTPEMLEAFCA